MMQLPLIRLAQGQLNLLEICPPQFQRLYLEELGSPISPEEQEKQSWGSQFHLLMQQRELGLPIDSLLKEDEEVQRSLNGLVAAVPEIGGLTGTILRDAEHCRTLNFQGYLLTVVYDLLIVEGKKAQILDWKTYLQPQSQKKLAQNWQTRLYLYVLAETSEYLPEQISMTYWFVRLPRTPASVNFIYNDLLHQQTRQDLSSILTKLDSWLAEYLDEGIAFPHRLNCQEVCPYYSSFFATWGKSSIDLYTSIENIEEVSI
ncbi:MAG: PD-(D/E)XK nuclease family protein [Gomphosphaeria aponina SAG 52.96 = DSM 107014]|uniref:PD-(D/E)XK nuclease family protein n=1 Tax=Gomphosphaeria aponina SAG 52.96 = DSM 107014 TaxID=1521640 RepID=A0A941GV67_9CHRO|nr:PD-(D/E)XK nuclease family protein [Gomphosphaeria aponina SAG 52.96 = DSM 107014]